MKLDIDSILGVLGDHLIHPYNDVDEVEFPDIGEIDEDEEIYSSSLKNIFKQEPKESDNQQDDGQLDDREIAVLEGDTDILYPDDAKDIEELDDRLREFWDEIRPIVLSREALGIRPSYRPRKPEGPEPHCAWYCPIHYYGHGWGIYIRESCLLSAARDIARCVDWSAVRLPPKLIIRDLLRSAFYMFFLHEQFHHKVESLGLRLLIATGSDRYRPYKSGVYRPSYLTSDCLEESLANADSFRRLREPRYKDKVDRAIAAGLKTYIRILMPLQPPGYAEGEKYLSDDSYRNGLYRLQSQILDALPAPTTPPNHWSIAPNMFTSLAKISDEIFLVLPKGAKPIFRPTSVDPGITVSSLALEKALTRYHGYSRVPGGGKGSHVKLKKPGSKTIHIPGNRSNLRPGVLNRIMRTVL